MRTSTKIIVFILIVFGLMQFFTPTRNLEPEYSSIKAFESETAPQAAVAEVLKNTCYDCHSNHTNYPWYGSIAPLSFWLNHHIEEGKEHLNLSEWENWNMEKKDHKLEEIAEEVLEGEMPLKSYTWAHQEARLTDAQRQAIAQWAEIARVALQLKHAPQ